MNLEKSLTQEMELASIWRYPKTNIIRNGKNIEAVRIVKGDHLCIHKGVIMNDYPCTTHEVIRCMGNVSGTILYFVLENLVTREQSNFVIAEHKTK
jgi:hypothetical protein